MPDSSACPLTNKKCIPCEAGTPPLSADQVQSYLGQVQGWELQEGVKIKKEFRFKDFKSAIQFVDGVAECAEQEGHHPGILITYNKVKITLSTHAIGGLSENDFILAAKIDAL